MKELRRLGRVAGLAVCAAAAIGASLAGAGIAEATVIRGLDLETMTREAEIIAVGRVEKIVSGWEDGRVYSDVTLLADEVLKGTPKAHAPLVFSVLGGSVDGIGQWVPGEARFAVGERVVVFLVQVHGRPMVLGLSQGKYLLETGPDGAGLLKPDPVGFGTLELMGPDGQIAPAPLPRPMALDALRRAIRGERK